VRQAELTIVDWPASSISMPQNHPAQVPTAWLGAPHAVAKRNDGDAGRRVALASSHCEVLYWPTQKEETNSPLRGPDEHKLY
jgi:hypothetical protein